MFYLSDILLWAALVFAGAATVCFLAWRASRLMYKKRAWLRNLAIFFVVFAVLAGAACYVASTNQSYAPIALPQPVLPVFKELSAPFAA